MNMRNKNKLDPHDLKEEARKKAQGERQKWLFNQNQYLVFFMILKRPLSFSALVKATGFSEPAIWKYLRSLQGDRLIFKDTVKPDEGLANVGDVVYRSIRETPVLLEDLFRPRVEESLGFLYRYFADNVKVKRKMKGEIDKFVAGMVKIASADYGQWREGMLRSWTKKPVVLS
jgi:DNA-binding Lrp family transcriptional regulator